MQPLTITFCNWSSKLSLHRTRTHPRSIRDESQFRHPSEEHPEWSTKDILRELEAIYFCVFADNLPPITLLGVRTKF